MLTWTRFFSTSAAALANNTPEKCFEFDLSTQMITSFTCTDTDVVVPNKINNVQVLKIGIGSFANRNLNSVVLPDRLQFVGLSAFEGNDITTMSIPESVTYIGYQAFARNQLSTLDIGCGSENKKIEYGAFTSNKLSSVELPRSIEALNMQAFDRSVKILSKECRWW